MGKITIDIITSKNNQLIKDTKKLLTSSKARHADNLFVLEGARLCFDVLNSVYEVKTLLITQRVYDKYRDKAEKLIEISAKAYYITDEVAEKLGETSNSQGIFCVCSMQNSASEKLGNKIVALDNVQDPSNVGAIIRTAEALGIDSIITYNCCDIYNPKLLRASMGSVLRMSISETEELEEGLLNLQADGYKVYSTVPSSNAKKITEVCFYNKVICVIGNEANGVEENIKRMSTELITIPMLGRAESLNAGAAASIIMWEMLR